MKFVYIASFMLGFVASSVTCMENNELFDFVLEQSHLKEKILINEIIEESQTPLQALQRYAQLLRVSKSVHMIFQDTTTRTRFLEKLIFKFPSFYELFGIEIQNRGDTVSNKGFEEAIYLLNTDVHWEDAYKQAHDKLSENKYFMALVELHRIISVNTEVDLTRKKEYIAKYGDINVQERLVQLAPLLQKIDLFNTYFFIDYYLYFIARQKELQPSNAISLLSPESYTLIGRLVSGQGLSDPSTFQRKAALSSQELLNTLIALKVIDVIKVNELKARLEPARIITPQYLYDGCWPAGVGEYSD